MVVFLKFLRVCKDFFLQLANLTILKHCFDYFLLFTEPFDVPKVGVNAEYTPPEVIYDRMYQVSTHTPQPEVIYERMYQVSPHTPSQRLFTTGCTRFVHKLPARGYLRQEVPGEYNQPNLHC